MKNPFQTGVTRVICSHAHFSSSLAALSLAALSLAASLLRKYILRMRWNRETKSDEVLGSLDSERMPEETERERCPRCSSDLVQPVTNASGLRTEALGA